MKVGMILEALTGAVLDPRVKEKVLFAAQWFREIGAIVEEVSIPLHKKGTAIWTGVSKVGGYLSKLYGAVGRRGYAMPDLNEMMHPLRQANWDEAYVS